MEYTLEELMPVVAKLSRKYTSGESTSVTYERANSLMEAVLYCIGECEGEHALAGKHVLSAGEAYELGYERLLERVKRTRESYNDMIVHFCAYGNENYHDTVTKALPGFFLYYDARFEPQENGITMDYPTIIPVRDVSGIHAIEKYLTYIRLEQKFMGTFPEEYVREILRKFHRSYEKLFCNICSILLRNVLGCMLIGTRTECETKETEYERLKQMVDRYSKEQLRAGLDTMICRMIREKWGSEMELEEYLKADTADFAAELVAAAKSGSLRNVVVL